MPPKKIFVVEDDYDIRYIISLIMNEEGHEVIERDKGYQVVQSIRATLPDLILLDVMLGDADGRDICKTLKQDPVTKSIPVLLVSATHGLHTAHEKNCGADGYISKPFELNDLIETVRAFV